MTVLFEAWPAGPPSKTETSALPSFSSTTASRTNSFGVGTIVSLSTMLIRLLALAITPLTAALRLKVKASNPSTTGQLTICTRTTLVVSPGAKLSVSETAA